MKDPILKPKQYFKKILYKTDHLLSDLPYSKLSTISDRFLMNNVETIAQELNDNFYRCDNFIKDHKGKHILFTGDSYAFGSGVSIEDSWPKIVYNKINEEVECSGYFNLAILGSSTQSCVIDIFKYCKEYGNPEVIFYGVNEPAKFYVYLSEQNAIADAIYDKESCELLKFLQYQQYFMLVEYCRINNIKLISWYAGDIHDELAEIEILNCVVEHPTFVRMNKTEALEYMDNFTKQNNVKYYSKDRVHYGAGFHNFIAEKIYQAYKDIK